MGKRSLLRNLSVGIVATLIVLFIVAIIINATAGRQQAPTEKHQTFTGNGPTLATQRFNLAGGDYKVTWSVSPDRSKPGEITRRWWWLCTTFSILLRLTVIQWSLK